MGVMACCRRGCDGIMCHDYSVETGYVCYECKAELEDTNPNCVQDEDGFILSKMFGEEV